MKVTTRYLRYRTLERTKYSEIFLEWLDDQAKRLGTTPEGVFNLLASGQSASQIASGAGGVKPLAGIKEVWLLGASIDDGIISEGALTEKFAAQMSAYAKREHGLDLVFKDHAVGTQTQDQIYSRWLTEKSAITGRSDVLVITMPMGNTVSDNRPYANQTPAFLESVRAQFVALMNDIKANGNIPMPVNTTFRNYDNNTLHSEQLGSLPYNENILVPSVLSMSPVMAWKGRPYADPYNITRNSYATFLNDPVHPSYQGYAALRWYWIDCIAARIKGIAPPVVDRIESPDVTPQPRVPTAATFYCANGGTDAARGTGILTASVVLPYTLATTDYYLPPSKGYALNTLRVTMPATAYGGNATALSTGDTSDSLLNDELRKLTWYTQSDTFVQFAVIKGLAPNQSVKLTMMAARNATASDRVGQYSIDGGATFVEQSGAVAPGVAPSLFTLTGKANAAGEVEIVWRRKAGSTFAYLNGVTVTPL